MRQFTRDKIYRTCPRCGRHGKIETDFGWRKAPAGPIPKTYCRPCMTETKREHQRVRRAKAREARLLANPPLPEPIPGMKRCSTCKLTFPFAEFHGPRLHRGVMRYEGSCKRCAKIARDKRRSSMTEAEKDAQRARDRESYHRNAETARRWNLQRLYNITVEQFDQMKAEQGGVCKICRQPETRVVRERIAELAIDHDHSCCKWQGRSCGKCIRGLLCSRCNMGIGFMRDDADLLRAAIEYLERSRQTG